MKKLYHYPICPLSRQSRVFLKELDIEFTTIKEDYWQFNKDFLKINPAGTLPILEESYGLFVIGIYPFVEYLNSKYPNFNFLDEDIDICCEIRRLFFWFNDKFYREVTKIIIDEKVIRSIAKMSSPRTEFLRAAKNNLNYHLEYITSLLEKRSYLVSDSLTIADIAASCHLSVLDYFGEIYWDKWTLIKHWYSLIKSRPAFRLLLQDRIPGFTPPSYYTDLDF